MHRLCGYWIDMTTAAATDEKKGLRFSITVFPALRDAIVKAAEADGRAKSDWIERALAKVLKVRKAG